MSSFQPDLVFHIYLPTMLIKKSKISERIWWRRIKLSKVVCEFCNTRVSVRCALELGKPDLGSINITCERINKILTNYRYLPLKEIP